MPRRPQNQLLQTLTLRFEAHRERHRRLAWEDVLARLEGHAAAWAALSRMEESGGEPDVIGRDAETGEYLFCDCAPETPAGRRSLCYDRAALDSRKQNKPSGSAVELAQAMGIELLTEAQYRKLQRLGEFDLKTSSWIATPPEVRALGGALFCDRRYGQVFVYHNGADSYYGVRGFRGLLRV